MAFAISIWFDDETENKIRLIWKDLHEKDITSVLHTGNYRPHITLAIYKELKVEEFRISLEKLLKDISPFKIILPSIGIFGTKPGIQSVSGNAVFLGVTPTIELLEFHKSVHQLLEIYGKEPISYYLPKSWNPHSSLGVKITSQEILKIIESTLQFELPIYPIATRVGIIDTPAEIELASFNLNNNE